MIALEELDSDTGLEPAASAEPLSVGFDTGEGLRASVALLGSFAVEEHCTATDLEPLGTQCIAEITVVVAAAGAGAVAAEVGTL